MMTHSIFPRYSAHHTLRFVQRVLRSNSPRQTFCSTKSAISLCSWQSLSSLQKIRRTSAFCQHRIFEFHSPINFRLLLTVMDLFENECTLVEVID